MRRGFGIGVGVAHSLRHGIIGGSAAFSPADLSPELWLRPEELGADSTLVTTWPDQSGNGNDATQGTTSSKPLVQAAVLDGYSGALFDDVDDYLILPDISATADDWNMFFVHGPASYKTADTLLGAAATIGRLLLTGRSSDFAYYDGVAWSQFGDSSGLDRQELLHYSLQGSGAVYLNGVSQTRTVGTGWTQTSLDKGGTTTLPRLGADDNFGPGSFLNGHIIEVCIVKGSLTADEIDLMEAYFSGRYPTLGI